MQREAETLGFVQHGEEKAKEGLYILDSYTEWVVTVEKEPKDKGMHSQRIRSNSYRLQQEKSRLVAKENISQVVNLAQTVVQPPGFGDAQNPPGEAPKQPSPALALMQCHSAVKQESTGAARYRGNQF